MFAAVDVEMSLNFAVDIFCGGADVNDVPTTIGTNGQVTLKPRKHLFKGHFGVISRQGTQGSHGLGRGDQAFLKFTRVGRTAALGLIKQHVGARQTDGNTQQGQDPAQGFHPLSPQFTAN